MKNPLVSIIIVDYKDNNPYLVENLNAIQKQTYKKYEIILVTDYKNSLKYPKLTKKSFGCYVGPAEKRDYGAKIAKGEILAFIDDDAYPDKNWLKNMIVHFRNTRIAGVGGPGVTPPNVPWKEEASGWAQASPIGAGPYIYRFHHKKKQWVDDYPSMNLAVRKNDFNKIKGFDSNFWPGEDTKLCLDLTHKLNKKIIYDPNVLVFHHRRPLWIPHLRQNGNYGLHRGFFARILPQTSLRVIYFLPSLMVLGLIFTIASLFYTGVIISYLRLTSITLFITYFFILAYNALWVFNESKKTNQAILSIPVIFITHLWYGVRFIQGLLFVKRLSR